MTQATAMPNFDNIREANEATLKALFSGNRVIVKPTEDHLKSLDIFTSFTLAGKQGKVMVFAGDKLQYVDASTLTKDSEPVMKVTLTSVGQSNFQGVLSLANETRRKVTKVYYVGLSLVSGKIQTRVIGLSNGGDNWQVESQVSAWGVTIGTGKLAVEAKDLLAGKTSKRQWKWNRDTQACEAIEAK